MFSFSLGFGVAGYAFVRSLAMGAQGLVWANVVNMALRIAWSSVFIRRYFKGYGVIPGWVEVAPSSMLVAVAVAVAAAVRGQGGLPAVAELGLVRQMVMGVGAGGVMAIAW